MWRIEYAARPWGERRADIRSAQICSLLANVHRDKEKKPDPYTLQDFMPFEEKIEDEDRDIVAPETKAWLYAMAARSQRGN